MRGGCARRHVRRTAFVAVQVSNPLLYEVRLLRPNGLATLAPHASAGVTVIHWVLDTPQERGNLLSKKIAALCFLGLNLLGYFLSVSMDFCLLRVIAISTDIFCDCLIFKGKDPVYGSI